MDVTPRMCANCACFARMKPNGAIIDEDSALDIEAQTVCRRNTPGARQVRVDIPRMRDGKPVMDKLNRPVMEPATIFQYGYPPTAPEAVCFDGWRPKGTPPGIIPIIPTAS